MDMTDALMIKTWRVTGATWRRIAEYAAETWPDRGYESGNQIEGRELCQEAARVLGEDHRDNCWE